MFNVHCSMFNCHFGTNRSAPVSIPFAGQQVCYLPGEAFFKRRSNMLEDSLFESRGGKRTRKPFTLVIAAVAHIVTIGVLVLIPLLETHALPLPAVNLPLWIPIPKHDLGPIKVFTDHSQAPRQSNPEAQAVTTFSAPQAI